MEEDLILGKEGDEEEEFLDEWYEYDLHAEIGSAYNALNAVADIDEKMVSKERGKLIASIKSMCIEIIHRNIKEIHKDVVERNTEEKII